MTAVVGVVDDTHIWIGVDSLGSNIDTHFSVSVKTEKVFEVGEFLFGACGSYRTTNLLRHHLQDYLQIQHQDESDEHFVHKTFLNAIFACFKNGGALFEHNDNQSESAFLFGYRGSLYVCQEDFSIQSFHDDYAATGAGRSECLASMYSTKHLPSKERIKVALEASSRYNITVAPPFIIKSILR
jgi:hypothetical protein